MVWVAGWLAFILLIGVISIRLGSNQISKKMDFCSEFQKEFRVWCESRGKNREAYTQLILESNKIQNLLGNQGVLDYIELPFRKPMINYAIILNTIPLIRQDFDFDINSLVKSSEATTLQYISLVDDSLLLYQGKLNEKLYNNETARWNPLEWLGVGLKTLCSTPIYLLNYFGLVSTSWVESALNNLLFKMFQAIFSFVALIAGLVTIFPSWKPEQKLSTLLHQLNLPWF